MRKHYFFLVVFGLWMMATAAWAQALGQNWYFGNNAGVQFGGGSGPVALTNGALVSYEGCAALSGYNGQLLAYTNGEIIWDKNHQPMPNGSSGLGGFASASQAAVLVPLPNSATTAYLFCVDAIENNLVGGFRYSIIDFALRGGLGDVTATKGVLLPTPTPGGKVTEKLTAVRHANGRDYWIVVHGWQSNAFYSFLLTPNGLAAAPVVTNVGAVHQGGQSFFNSGNAIGCMKASPNGQWLALAKRDSDTELYNFNNSTGQLSNYQALGSFYYNYGVEFSADNSRLYVSGIFGQVMQFNLQAGSGGAIASSVQIVQNSSDRYGSLQRGPDNRIYVTNYNTPYLDVINTPNALGAACGYTRQGLALAGRLDQYGLPNLPNLFAGGDVAASFAVPPTCANPTVSFTGGPATSVGMPTWDFGDPASGSTNTATGLTPTHTFSQPGTYQVTLTVPYSIFFAPATATQTVTISPAPTLTLGADTTACGTSVLLQVRGGLPAGTAYRWQDGSTTTSYLAQQSGVYSVQVTTPGGCTATASRRVTINPLPAPRLADTTACGSSVLLRVRGSLPVGSTYRWQDNSTGTTYLARQSGTYSVVVTTPQGCQATATSRVVLGPVLTVTLGTDTLVCPQATFVLRPSPQPAGTTYRWQDGSTASTYVAHGPGTYSVQVQSASAGCTATATRVANPLSCPIIIPNIITPNGDVANDYFELKGLTAADWSIRIFDRWGRQVYSQARYDNRWGAADQSAGIYYYLLTNAAGQQYKGWVEVVRAN